MIQDFNLIVSTARGRESAAAAEAWYLLGRVGDPEALLEPSPIPGLVVGRTGLLPMEAVSRLRRLFEESPYEFHHVLKVTPVQRVVQAELGAIGDAARELSQGIGEAESFRVTVNKRRTPLSSREVIEAAASGVAKRVNLDNPDWVIQVEVIGSLTGLSLLRPGAVFSAAAERRPTLNP